MSFADSIFNAISSVTTTTTTTKTTTTTTTRKPAAPVAPAPAPVARSLPPPQPPVEESSSSSSSSEEEYEDEQSIEERSFHSVHSEPIVSPTKTRALYDPYADAFGQPETIVPRDVAVRFPEASSYFPSSLLLTAPIPLEREEQTRFDGLWSRRDALGPYDEARHAAADQRRERLREKALLDKQRRELRRATKQDEIPKDGVWRLGFNDEVSPALVNASFHRTHQVLEPYNRGPYNSTDPDYTIPLSEEEKIRFMGVGERRNSVKKIDDERHEHADNKREALMKDRQLLQKKLGRKYEGKMIVPAENAAQFKYNSQFFEDPLLNGYNRNHVKMPVKQEEKIRFEPLQKRRDYLAPFEALSHEEAEARRSAILMDRTLTIKKKEDDHKDFIGSDRHLQQQGIGRMTREIKEGLAARDVLMTHIPVDVTPADNADNFPYSQRYFRKEGLDEYNTDERSLPITEEEKIRFDPLYARREKLAPFERRRMSDANSRRNSQLIDRALAIKKKEDDHKDFIGSDRQLAQQGIGKASREINDGLAARDVTFFGLPANVTPAKNAEEFPNSAQYFDVEGLDDYNRNETDLPLTEEEKIRFDAVQRRREKLAPFEKARAEDSEKRRDRMLNRRSSNLSEKAAQRARQAEEAKEEKRRLLEEGADAEKALKELDDKERKAREEEDEEDAKKEEEPQQKSRGLIPPVVVAEKPADDGEADDDDDKPLITSTTSTTTTTSAMFAESRPLDDDNPNNRSTTSVTSHSTTTTTSTIISSRKPPKKADDDAAPNKARSLAAAAPPTGDDKKKSELVHESELPDEVCIGDIERHFPGAKAAMDEFSGPNPNATRMMPLAEEQRLRFARVPARRAGDKKRRDQQTDRQDKSRAVLAEARKQKAANKSKRMKEGVAAREAERDEKNKAVEQSRDAADERREGLLEARKQKAEEKSQKMKEGVAAKEAERAEKNKAIEQSLDAADERRDSLISSRRNSLQEKDKRRAAKASKALSDKRSGKARPIDQEKDVRDFLASNKN